MDQTHIHLLITHLPIFGSILGAIVLGYGLWAKSTHTIIAAYVVLIISSIGAVISYVTGEAAEETVENIQGIGKTMVDQHEDFALFALIALILLGLVSLVGLFLNLRKSSLTTTVALVACIISLIAFGLVARTGYLGGQIRHTEISTSSGSPGLNMGGQNNEE
ncbi:MAG TPA: hypothetical protein VLZ28_06850 [Daejeonella sp.]|nr:hypothetical protein [Daejeonella sp.]